MSREKKETNLDDVISATATSTTSTPSSAKLTSQFSFTQNLKNLIDNKTTTTSNLLLSPIPTQVQRQWGNQAVGEHGEVQQNYKSRETRRNSTIIDRRRVSLGGGGLALAKVVEESSTATTTTASATAKQQQTTLDSFNDECSRPYLVIISLKKLEWLFLGSKEPELTSRRSYIRKWKPPMN